MKKMSLVDIVEALHFVGMHFFTSISFTINPTKFPDNLQLYLGSIMFF